MMGWFRKNAGGYSLDGAALGRDTNSGSTDPARLGYRQEDTLIENTVVAGSLQDTLDQLQMEYFLDEMFDQGM